MPIGLVSDEEMEREIKNNSVPQKPVETPKSIPQAEVIDINKPGRPLGANAVPTSLQAILGATAITHGRKEALQIAEAFKVSDSSVSAYTNGAASTSSYDRPKPELAKVTRNARSRIQLKAQRVLRKSLDNITDDKLEDLNAKDLASVAKNLSGVVRDLEVEEINKGNAQQNFIIYAPYTKPADSFTVIDVAE